MSEAAPHRAGWTLPALLLVIGLLGAGLAWGSKPQVPEPAAARAAATTPILSVRRIPGLVQRELADRRLRSRLDSALRAPGIGGAAEASCLVVRRGERLIHAIRPALALIPASNLKLLTAAAALRVLGPDHRFRTEFRATGPLKDGIVDGDLWVVGGGDPILMTPEYAAAQRFQPQVVHPVDALAEALAAAGVREVRGAIIGDESRYDSMRYLPSWKASYRTAGEVGPQSALVVNDGFANFAPGKTAASDPAAHAAGMIAQAAERRGIVVGASRSGAAPANAVTIAHLDSRPLSEIIGGLLTLSDNNTGELLVKELGVVRAGAGTTAAGLGVVREAIEGIGVDLADQPIADGSGLDRGSRISCSTIDRVLTSAGADGPLGGGLALAGRSGTLADRFESTPAAGRLRAKTGALAGVASLSGWVPPPEGEPLAFAFIANGLPSEPTGRALQEQIGTALALYPEAPPLVQLRPPTPS